MENLDVIKPVLDLGMTGILLYFLLVVWKDRKEEVAKSDRKVEEKDKIINDLSNTVVGIVKENTKVQEELKATIRENTKATETLTGRIYQLLDGHKKV